MQRSCFAIGCHNGYAAAGAAAMKVLSNRSATCKYAIGMTRVACTFFWHTLTY